jgi:hypothetical protein
MAADERSEYFCDGGSIVRGVVGDALKRVDPSEPHVQFGMAELVDRAGKPFSDLALAAGLKLSVGEVGVEQDDRSADALQQGGTDIVDGLGPVGGGEGARRGAKLPLHEPLWNDQHAGQDDHQREQAGKGPAEARQPLPDEASRASGHAIILLVSAAWPGRSAYLAAQVTFANPEPSWTLGRPARTLRLQSCGPTL